MLTFVVHSIQIMDLWLFCQRLELDRSDYYSLLFDCICLSTISYRIRFCDVEVRCCFLTVYQFELHINTHVYRVIDETLFSYHHIELSTFLFRIFMSIVFILYCIRILHLFAAYKALGPKLLIIYKMVTHGSE